MAKSSISNQRQYLWTNQFVCPLKISYCVIIHSLLDLGNRTIGVGYRRFGKKLHHGLGLIYRLVVVVSEQILLRSGTVSIHGERVQLDRTFSLLNPKLTSSHMAQVESIPGTSDRIARVQLYGTLESRPSLVPLPLVFLPDCGQHDIRLSQCSIKRRCLLRKLQGFRIGQLW